MRATTVARMEAITLISSKPMTRPTKLWRSILPKRKH